MGLYAMDKLSLQVRSKFLLEAPQEPHLFQALKGSNMPATQSALVRISARKARGASAAGVAANANLPVKLATEAGYHGPISANALVQTLADAIAAWHSHLPPHLQVALLALIHGGATIDVQSIAACAPDQVRISGICQGQAYKLVAAVTELHFVCVPQTDKQGSKTDPIQFEVAGETIRATCQTHSN